MGIVTEPGFYNGRFLKAGQFADAEKEVVATGVGEPAATNAPVELSAMSKDELVAEAEKRGVEVKAGDTKAEIIKALETQ